MLELVCRLKAAGAALIADQIEAFLRAQRNGTRMDADERG